MDRGAYNLTRGENLYARLIMLACIIVCALGYTMFPADSISPLATPSTSGIRFLPAVIMAMFIISVSGVPLTRRHVIIGNLIWALGIFWSPEAGIHTTVLWSPFLVWMGVFADGNPFSLRRFVTQGFQVLGTFILILVGLLLIYFLVFGHLPSLEMYAAYLQNPPGALAINSSGPIWFALSCFGLWFAAALRINSTAASQSDMIASWVLMILALVTFTYFLGRSHDNNILNLLPYLVLLLISVRRIASAPSLRTLCNCLIAASLAWTPLFGWSTYQNSFLGTGAQKSSIAYAMSYDNPRNVEAIAHHLERHSILETHETLVRQRDLRNALSYINAQWDEPIEIIDANILIDGGSTHLPWSGVHPISTSLFLPSPLRSRILSQVALKLEKTGWIVIDKNFNLQIILDEYDESYHRDQEHVFGSVTAIRYVPKLSRPN